MNNKYLCRIVTNIYISLNSNINILDIEIDKLRKGKKTSISQLNLIYEYHNKIIKNNGNLPFDYIFSYYNRINKYNIEENMISNIKHLYNNGEVYKIIDLLNISKYIDKSSYLLIELTVNCLMYKLFKIMLIFNIKIYNKLLFNRCSNIKEELFLTSYKYLKKRPILTISKIHQLLYDFYYRFNSEFLIEKIYLFGSYAKGNADEYSDIDLFIITKNKKIPSDLIKLVTYSYFKKIVQYDIDLTHRYTDEKNDSFQSYILKYAIRII